MQNQVLKKNILKRIQAIISLAAALMVFGIAGYMLIEDWSLFESLYMTIITLTTVGFNEVRPLSDAGRVFTVLLITCGVGSWAYVIGATLRLLVEGHLKIFFTQRRMEKMIGSLKNHFIVCGFGRMGSLVCNQLAEEKIPFVVVEKKLNPIEELKKRDYLYVEGSATEEETLINAGIGSARALIAALASDAGNVYTVLTARHLNPKLFIVCRSDDEEAEDKIRKAGADRVISPYRIGGRSLANAAMRPHVLDFIDLVTTKEELALSIEEVPVTTGSPLAGRTLVESRIRERFGIIIVACRTRADEMIFNPPAGYTINEGDVLVALGRPEELQQLYQGIPMRTPAGKP